MRHIYLPRGFEVPPSPLKVRHRVEKMNYKDPRIGQTVCGIRFVYLGHRTSRALRHFACGRCPS